jgi:hypothetical protein
MQFTSNNDFTTEKANTHMANSFCCHVPTIWNENTNSQFIIDSYAVSTYYSSYMKKLDKTMTTTFKHI